MFGLTFANPAMLHALWAVLLPVLIHLLNRRRAVTVSFSNVALLQTLQQDRMRRIRLKQMLLLALRTLLVFVLVVAFARPTLRTGTAGMARGVRTSAALLLDRSLSMRHRTPKGTLFERAQGQMREALKLLDARDEVGVFLVDDRTEPLNAGHLDVLKAQLDGLQPTFRGTNLRPGIEAALAQLRSSEMLNRELYLFTDLARNGWSSMPDSLPDIGGISVFVVPVRPQQADNLGVRQAGPAGQMLVAETPASLQVELANYGESHRPEVAVQVYLDGRRIAQEMVSLPAGEIQRIYMRFTPEAAGRVVLQVVLGDDDLAADNVYATVLNIPEQIHVLLVGETEEDFYYLERALLASSSSQGAITVAPCLPDALTSDILTRADLVFLCNVSQLGHRALLALKHRVEAGAGLMICLGDRVDIRHYNDRLLPALFPATLISVTGTPAQTQSYQALRLPLPDHPVFEATVQEEGFRSPHFYAHYRVRLGEGAQPMLLFGSGAPALSEAQVGAGRAVLFASKADLAWTDFPLTGLWVPFIHRLSRYLARGASGEADYAVGTAIFRDVRGISAREALVRPPQGEERTIWSEPRGGRTVWPVGEADMPGIWEIFAQERLADRFAVHVPADEPDLAPVTPARLSTLFAGTRVRIVGPEEPIADAVLEQRHGRELWRLFLGAALALMVAEMLIARSTQTSREAENE